VPGSDAELPALFRGLGIPGAVDVHVHFMPEAVLRKVWAYFDAAGRWPVRYRYDEPTRLAILRGLGVVAHTALLYPHKPGMAAWLNDWGVEFGRRVEACVPTGTFYPEPEAAGYVRAAVDRGIPT